MSLSQILQFGFDLFDGSKTYKFSIHLIGLGRLLIYLIINTKLFILIDLHFLGNAGVLFELRLMLFNYQYLNLFIIMRK